MRLLVRLDPRLVALCLAVFICQLLWALLSPPWQSPDEPAHFAYVQSLVERKELPQPNDSEGERYIFSTEQRIAFEAMNARHLAGNPTVKPPWSLNSERQWALQEQALGSAERSDGGGPNPARSNPPLYYIYEAIPYLMGSTGTVFDRLYLMRIWSALLLLVAVIASWFAVGELLGRQNALAQWVGALCVGLQPMATFMSSSVNPDIAVLCCAALLFWLGIRTIRRGVTGARVGGLLAVALMAVLVKPVGLALLPATVYAILAGRQSISSRHRYSSLPWWTKALVILTLGVGAAAIGSLAFKQLVPSGGSLPGFLSYLWQAYLPQLPFQTTFVGLDGASAYELWFRRGWGAFGWLEVRLPSGTYTALALCSLTALGFFVRALLQRRVKLPGAVYVFAGLIALTTLLGLHLFEYRVLVENQERFIQGRYLLPLLPIAAAVASVAVAGLRVRTQLLAATLIGCFALVLQVLSLGSLALRFYA